MYASLLHHSEDHKFEDSHFDSLEAPPLPKNQTSTIDVSMNNLVSENANRPEDNKSSEYSIMANFESRVEDSPKKTEESSILTSSFLENTLIVDQQHPVILEETVEAPKIVP
jgi:hypothetical protein